jgi:hypothetical protein
VAAAAADDQTWTMILEFNDTPEGLVVDVEVVAGECVSPKCCASWLIR